MQVDTGWFCAGRYRLAQCRYRQIELLDLALGQLSFPRLLLTLTLTLTLALTDVGLSSTVCRLPSAVYRLSGHWYEGGGLYRAVHLVRAEHIHFVHDGVYVNPQPLPQPLPQPIQGQGQGQGEGQAVAVQASAGDVLWHV